MLRKEHIQAIVPLVQQLDARGVVLAPEGGSPLQVLNDTMAISGAVLSPTSRNASDYVINEGDIIALSDAYGSQSRGEFSDHTMTMEALKSDIAKAVSTHLSFAKNVAKPLIVMYHAQVVKALQAYRHSSTDDFKITKHALPAPMAIEAIRLEIEEVGDVQLIPNQESMDLSVQGSVRDFILEHVITGDKEVDEAVGLWLSAKGEAFLTKVWSTAFTRGGVQNLTGLYLERDRYDSAALVFLLCRKLLDNPPEGTGMSLGTYSMGILSLKQQAALRLQGAYGEWESAMTSGEVIRYLPTDSTGEIVVYQHTYDQYIGEGGDNTLLMAATLLRQPPRHIHALQEKQAELRRAWDGYVAQSELVEANRSTMRIKKTLREELVRVVSANPKLTFGSLPGQDSVDWTQWEAISGGQLDLWKQALTRCDEQISHFTEKYLVDLWDACLDVVCKGLYPLTASHQILTYMHKACLKNPNLDVQEAVLLATNTYVCDYVADQLQIVKSI